MEEVVVIPGEGGMMGLRVMGREDDEVLVSDGTESEVGLLRV